ncbi:LysR family transcriptional regulator [Burkholderia sp. FERM BP-3421]|jgi:DNA-binding transcriptional LysR family regulator|uniref:LysR family transcriptional regulator n=1 Tax=Burkholderia sp. FERM BP-3421 TaxID=1494466 RepID=UPI002361F374|nr:LysR family transcriptional regulator [Burkholderia sp. FERM BP-3421]WDD96185.1 LysR family transcriptional regulator [Burkholderia sp. FERM BP-3421]
MDDLLSPHLSVFVDVVDQQGFSAVARRLGVAASSVTRRIDHLEAQLGLPLLHRTTHAVKPTEAGQLLYERAKGLLAEIRGLQEDLHSRHSEPGGLLRVDCPAPFGRLHLMPAVAAFMRRHPALDVELLLTDSMVDPHGERLGAEVDLALRIGPLEDTRLVATVLAPQRRVLCASPAYLERCGAPASLDALAEHDCLAWVGAPPPGAWRFGERRLPPARPRFRSNHSEALLAAALDGLGIAHLPTWLAGDALRAGTLQRVLPALGAIEERATIHLLRQQARGSARTLRLIEFLKAWFAPPPWEREAG